MQQGALEAGMFVLYPVDNETHDHEIITRYTLPRLAVMYKNESVWRVPGTVSADD